MDAPTHTLLAYATSPGNVASDGDGANGLYTENLLREIKAPEAKIEDVFKRVRLGVRRKSNGAQIPWESTSLEDDFWFLPPKELKKLADADRERLFQQELALWEKIKESNDPAPLEDYLRRYPSGDFSELAQLQLDRVLAEQGEKRIAIASAAGNPFTKGSAQADTKFRVGDSYTNRVSALLTGVEKSTFTMTVAQMTDSEVIFDTGAGTFDAFRIEGRGITTGLPVGRVEMRPKWWMAPGQVRWPIRSEDHRTTARGERNLVAELHELVSFKQG